MRIASFPLRVEMDQNKNLVSKEEWGKEFWIDNQLYLLY